MIRKLSVLLYLQLKLTLKQLPVILIGTVIFSGAAAFLLFGFLSAEQNRDTSSLSRSTVGIIYDASDSELSFIISALGSMKEISQLCRLQAVSEEGGLQQLREGELDAVVYLPDGLIASIMDGRNIPAKIVLRNSGVNSSSGLVRSFIDTAAHDLATAQAGIYTLGYAARLAGLSSDAQMQINQQINKDYFQFFMNRGKIFSKKTVSSTGNLTLIQYYVCSGFVLILLFSGISCAGLLSAPDTGLKRSLSRQPLLLWSYAFIQSLAVSLPYWIAAVLIFCRCGFSFSGVTLFLIIFTAVSMSALLYRLCRSRAAAMLIICGSSVGMLFLAGGFIPSVFLPDTVLTIGNILPAGCLFVAMQTMLSGASFVFPSFCVLYGIMFNFAAGLIDIKLT